MIHSETTPHQETPMISKARRTPTPRIPLQPQAQLDANEKKFIKRLLKEGQMPLNTAAFAFGTGGVRSDPVTLGYVEQFGGVKPDDVSSKVRLTAKGKAFAQSLR